MWPLLKKDGLQLQYLVLSLAWNFVIGYNPITLRRSFVKYLSIVSPIYWSLRDESDRFLPQITYSLILGLHILESVANPPTHLPDLFVVLNLTLSAAVYGLAFLWGSKRSLQEGWSVVGMSMLGSNEKRMSGR